MSIEKDFLKMRDRWEEEFKKELIKEGWTPPGKKEEFKKGDYVLVSRQGGKESLGKYAHTVQGGYFLIEENGIYYDECRHAPTWIKWEEGPAPKDGAIIIQYNSGNYCIRRGFTVSMLDIKRWAWMPEEE